MIHVTVVLTHKIYIPLSNFSTYFSVFVVFLSPDSNQILTKPTNTLNETKLKRLTTVLSVCKVHGNAMEVLFLSKHMRVSLK